MALCVSLNWKMYDNVDELWRQVPVSVGSRLCLKSVDRRCVVSQSKGEKEAYGSNSCSHQVRHAQCSRRKAATVLLLFLIFFLSSLSSFFLIFLFFLFLFPSSSSSPFFKISILLENITLFCPWQPKHTEANSKSSMLSKPASELPSRCRKTWMKATLYLKHLFWEWIHRCFSSRMSFLLSFLVTHRCCEMLWWLAVGYQRCDTILNWVHRTS